MSSDFLTAIMVGRHGAFEYFRTEMGMGSGRRVRFFGSLPHFDRQAVLELAQRTAPQVIAVEAEAPGFEVGAVLGLRQGIDRPFVLVGLAQAGSPGAELMGGGGFDAIFTLPGNGQTAAHIDEQLPPLYQQISADWGKGAWDAVTPEMVRAATRAAASSPWQKKTFTFWSPKGGVGKTFLAVEVAVLLAGLGGRQVILVDGNMNGGHVGLRLNMPSRRNILTAAQGYDSASDKEQYLPVVVRDNLQAVPGLENLVVMAGVTNQNEAVTHALYQDRGYEFSLALLDHVILVVDSGVASINDACYGVHTTLKRLGVEPGPGDRISLVMNNWQDGVGVRMSDAAREIGVSALGIVPRDTSGALMRAGNQGISYVASYGKKKKNGREVEDTLAGLAAIAGSFYPPIAESWALRKTPRKCRKLFGRGG
jgi:MinD-like ATPase involved in chromosome partitioning or flagellar assembly